MPNIKPTTKNKLRELQLDDKFRKYIIKYIEKFESKEKCKIYFNYELNIRLKK